MALKSGHSFFLKGSAGCQNSHEPSICRARFNAFSALGPLLVCWNDDAMFHRTVAQSMNSGPCTLSEDIECLLKVRNGLQVEPAGVSNESQTVQHYSAVTPGCVFLVEDLKRT